MNARLMMCVMAQFALLTCGTSLMAQDESAEQPAGRTGRGPVAIEQTAPEDEAPLLEVRAIQLQSTDPYSIADVLSEFYRKKFVPVPHINSILVLCTEVEYRDIKTLVAKLDVATSPKREPTFHVLPVRYRSVTEIMEHLEPIVEKGMVQVSADLYRSSLVVVSYSDEAFKAMDSLLKALDTPTRSVRLEFAVFLADPAATEEQHPIPSDLDEVAHELSRFGHLKLMGRYQVEIAEGSQYSIQGAAHEGLEAQVHGEVVGADQGQPVRVSVRGRIAIKDSIMREGGPVTQRVNRQGSFEIDTILALPPNEFVALGASAAGVTEGQSLILVVRVQP